MPSGYLGSHVNRVFSETWGHLAPLKNTSYKIKIWFCVAGYQQCDQQILSTEYGDGLNDSPWLYDCMHNYIRNFNFDNVPTGVYLIDGTFRNYRIYGKPKIVFKP